MTQISDPTNVTDEHSLLDVMTCKTKIIYAEFLEEIKKEHNLTESIYDLEVRYFTTYLFILKYVNIYVSRPKELKGNTAYVVITDWEDFKFKIKEKAKNLLISFND